MFSVIFPPSVIGVLTVIVMIGWMSACFILLLPAILLKLVPYHPLQRGCAHY